MILRTETPNLIDMNDKMLQPLFGDLVDLTCSGEEPPKIDMSPSRRSGHKLELLDGEISRESPFTLIRHFPSGIPCSHTGALGAETDFQDLVGP
jgi:hypothetical protein